MPGQPEPPVPIRPPRRPEPEARPGRGGRPRPRGPAARVLLAVGAGGAAGSLARHELALAWPVRSGGFPWTTFAVNVSGSLVLGALLALVAERWPPTRYVRPLVGTGACGGYTTWSTFMAETALLVRAGRAGTAAAYMAASVVGGIAACFAGMSLGRRWPAPAGPRRSR